MALIDNVIAWVFVAAFVAIVFGAVLSFFGIIKINDPEQRKWAFRSVLAVIVVAVIGYGVKIFTPSPTSKQSQDTVTPVAQSPTPAVPQTPAKTVEPLPPRNDQTPKVATAVSQWAALNMPTRPTISSQFDADYPSCVAMRREDTASITKVVATECRRDLELHKSQHISKYYAVKPLYDAAILEKQQELSRGRLTVDETEVFNFLIDENEDLNFEGGKSLGALNAAEARINDDIAFFRVRQ